jgi:hypothetical protein
VLETQCGRMESSRCIVLAGIVSAALVLHCSYPGLCAQNPRALLLELIEEAKRRGEAVRRQRDALLQQQEAAMETGDDIDMDALEVRCPCARGPACVGVWGCFFFEIVVLRKMEGGGGGCRTEFPSLGVRRTPCVLSRFALRVALAAQAMEVILLDLDAAEDSCQRDLEWLHNQQRILSWAATCVMHCEPHEVGQRHVLYGRA